MRCGLQERLIQSLRQCFNQVTGKRQRLFEHLFEGGSAGLLDQTVGIFALGQEHKTDFLSIIQEPEATNPIARFAALPPCRHLRQTEKMTVIGHLKKAFNMLSSNRCTSGAQASPNPA